MSVNADILASHRVPLFRRHGCVFTEVLSADSAVSIYLYIAAPSDTLFYATTRLGAAFGYISLACFGHSSNTVVVQHSDRGKGVFAIVLEFRGRQAALVISPLLCPACGANVKYKHLRRSGKGRHSDQPIVLPCLEPRAGTRDRAISERYQEPDVRIRATVAAAARAKR